MSFTRKGFFASLGSAMAGALLGYQRGADGTEQSTTTGAPAQAAALGVNVRNYGAAGDGETDDTVAVQTAIDSVGARAPGGTVYFPVGQYRIRGTLRARGSLRYLGASRSIDGSVLLKREAGNIFEYSSMYDASFEHLTFSATAAGVAAFRQTDPSDYTARCVFANLNFRTELSEGLYFNPVLSQIEKCRFGVNGSPLGTQHRAVYAFGDIADKTSNANVVRDCVVNSAFGVPAAMHWEAGNGLRIEGTDFEANRSRPLDILGMRNFSMSHCWFENNGDPFQVRLARDRSNTINQLITSVQHTLFNCNNPANTAIFDIAPLGAELSEFAFNTLVDSRGGGTRYISHLRGAYNRRVENYHHNEVASGDWMVPAWRLMSSASAWNNGALRLGDHYLWVDSAGRLRIKRGIPSGDLDGNLVGGTR
jgi:hypothetical protein